MIEKLGIATAFFFLTFLYQTLGSLEITSELNEERAFYLYT